VAVTDPGGRAAAAPAPADHAAVSQQRVEDRLEGGRLDAAQAHPLGPARRPRDQLGRRRRDPDQLGQQLAHGVVGPAVDGRRRHLQLEGGAVAAHHLGAARAGLHVQGHDEVVAVDGVEVLEGHQRALRTDGGGGGMP
jgi:hypothetical protein